MRVCVLVSDVITRTTTKSNSLRTRVWQKRIRNKLDISSNRKGSRPRHLLYYYQSKVAAIRGSITIKG